jgi:hypothetical protein
MPAEKNSMREGAPHDETEASDPSR